MSNSASSGGIGLTVGAPVRILIVEDCAPDAELAANEIRRAGLAIETRVVETSETFLAALLEFRPDLILSDYRLPHFDGMAALRLTLEHAPTTPLLISTGSTNEEVAVACMKAGAWDYILKENLTRLGLAVRVALERKLDLAEKARTERLLAESGRRYRKLSVHLQQVRERERTVIAREIHDELGQSLTALKIDLSLLRPGAGDFEERRREMSNLIDQTIGTVQRITAELRPGVLDDLGLEAAAEWQVKTFKARTGIACTFTSEGHPGALDRDRQTAMFRILQEALTNVARHAVATHVTVALYQDEDGANLFMRDNGRGLLAAELDNPRSYGLIGMQERASEFGGHVDFHPAPGGGTVVQARILKEDRRKPR
ncbi:MAG: hybrid sensor histidine kinase/response regulator [Candidatus Geothermincolia bacterium]